MPEPHRQQVYLAGPISNCNERQRKLWRNEFKGMFPAKEFQWIDPVEWVGVWKPEKEILAIDQADVVVANLWKESVGTVVGIVHARQKGKPVVLIDANHIDSRMLEQLVLPEKPVRSLGDAAKRLREIVKTSETFKVRKSSGEVTAFSPTKLMRSLSRACQEAKADAQFLPSLVFAAVNQSLREIADGGVVGTMQIKDQVIRELRKIESSGPAYSSGLKEAAGRAATAWKRLEALKDISTVLEEREREIGQKQKEIDRLRELIEDLRVPADDGADEIEQAPAEPEFDSVSDAVRQAAKDHKGFLDVWPTAFGSAKISPFKNPKRVYSALSWLGRYARFRQDRFTTGQPVTGLNEYYKNNPPGFEIAFKESETVHNNEKLMQQRTFTNRDRTLVMEKHVKLGKGGPDTCLRLYFELDGERHQIIVGFVGNHPDTMNSN